MKVALFGATGYTGSLLLKLILSHPNIEEVYVFSTTSAGNEVGISSEKIKYGKYLPYENMDDYDFEVVFSALPHLSSSEYYVGLIDDKIIIDLAADLRLNDRNVFEEVYGRLPASQKYIGKSVYGLTEINFEDISKSNLIANPGCYPTVSLLAILPVVREFKSVSNIIINAISGLSGAGKKANVDLLFSERADNVNVYSPGNSHRHHCEIQEKIGKYNNKVSISFNPYLIPVNRGIYSSCTIIFEESTTFDQINQLFNDIYSNKPFINIVPLEKLQLKEVIATNNCNISFSLNGNHLQVFSCIDNLMKGAAGAAIQNFNIRFGLPETTNLPTTNLL
ncbi:MAG: N-acetyl-gamma-glutamyl-phosphate reductase [Ignavibacteria bacterium]|nr:N-acetyl-gamma-glutamyl-phosphate reductase [Ignavibacteria bacterium]